MRKKSSYLLKTAVLAVGLVGFAPLAAGFYYNGIYYSNVAAFCSFEWVHAHHYVPPICAGYTGHYYDYPGNPSWGYYNGGYNYYSGNSGVYNSATYYGNPSYYHSGYSNAYHSNAYQYPNYTKYNGAYGGHAYTSPYGNAYTHPYNYNAHPGHGSGPVGDTNAKYYYGYGHAGVVRR
jgi:hypothetical protein